MQARDLAEYAWPACADALDARGFALLLPGLLTAEICNSMSAMFDRDEAFRSHIVMRRHGFGEGEYKYFAHPLPDVVRALRVALYARFAPIANAWMAKLHGARPYPRAHGAFVTHCHEAGQMRPTPLLLR